MNSDKTAEEKRAKKVYSLNFSLDVFNSLSELESTEGDAGLKLPNGTLGDVEKILGHLKATVGVKAAKLKKKKNLTGIFLEMYQNAYKKL